jgi:D-serine deaminase-like pyridoxal phosphate-dependent protein
VDPVALARLRAEPVDWRFKGFPATDRPVTVGTVGDQGWNALDGTFLLPVCILRRSALEHNLRLMREWCTAHAVSLAPHGKTPMAPQLVDAQLAAGAWGVTVATVSQARVYRAFGVERLLIANEVVEPAALAWIAHELRADPALDVLCLADSLEAVRIMERGLAAPARPLRVLVELGLRGGRTGARSVTQAREVAEAVHSGAGLQLAGVEAFEGIIHGPTAAATRRDVDRFVARVRDLTRSLIADGLFDGADEVIVSAGGSAFFDRVAEGLRDIDARVRVVVRSGCYLAHDSGMYEELSPLGRRAMDGERLEHALEVWGVVLSRPEPTLALVGAGKRDVSYDVGLPVPLAVRDRHGARSVRGQMDVFELNDQHAYVRIEPADPLAPGDLVGLGISHPCTTFDKWRLIPVVDDDYAVVDAVATYF